MSGLRVLIVGASVAGPMAAYWLAKAGADVTVIERYPSLRTGGQNIDIRTCGVTVMRKIKGMEAAVRASAAPLDGMAVVDERDRPYVTFRATGKAEQQSLVSEYEIFRDDLSRILVDLTKDNPNIHYQFNEQISSIEQNEKKVIVDFTNGSLPRSQFDLVVAADGATSRTRALGLQSKVRDHIYPLNAWAAYCTVNKDFLRGSRIAVFTTSTPGRAIGFGPDHDPAKNRVVMMGSHGRGHASEASLHSFQEALKGGDEALKAFLLRYYEGHERDEALAAVMKSDNLYASESMQVKVPSLHNGRFVMIGDAGYAAGPIGTGTSLAMTGAYILAGEINDHPGDLTAGLKSYSDRMQPIIKDMQQIPPGFPGIMTPQTAWGLWIRNAVLQIIAILMIVGQWRPIAALFSWIVGMFSAGLGKDKYNIPDYNWKVDQEEIKDKE